MSENLFHPLHLLWTSIIGLIIIWSVTVLKNWRAIKQLRHFRKAGNAGFNGAGGLK